MIIAMLAISFLGGWEKLWPGTEGFYFDDVFQLSDGSFILTYFDGNDHLEIKTYVMRLDPFGNPVWVQRYEGSDSVDRVLTTTMLDDSTFILGGYTWDYHSPYSKMWLFSINTDGDTLWTYEEDEGWNYSAKSIDITRDEHIIMLMTNRTIGKYTLDRERVWTYVFPYDWHIGAHTKKVITVLGHEPPGYAIIGDTGYGSVTDIFFARYNEYDHTHNDTSWICYYDASEKDVVWDIIEITNPAPGYPKGFLLVGSNSNATCCTLLCYAVRIDTAGDTLWTREYCHPLYEWTGLVHGMQEIHKVVWAGNEPHQTKFMLMAYTAYPDSLREEYAMWLLQISDTLRGDTLWTQTYDKYVSTFPRDITLCEDGGYAIAGFVRDPDLLPVGSLGALWLLRVDSLGNDLPSAISEIADKPDVISLTSYPNPFNSAVTISFDCGSESSKRLSTIEIFDLNGRLISVISTERSDEKSPTYPNEISRQARNDSMSEYVWTPGDNIPSGVYLVRAKIGDRDITKRVVYLK